MPDKMWVLIYSSPGAEAFITSLPNMETSVWNEFSSLWSLSLSGEPTKFSMFHTTSYFHGTCKRLISQRSRLLTQTWLSYRLGTNIEAHTHTCTHRNTETHAQKEKIKEYMVTENLFCLGIQAVKTLDIIFFKLSLQYLEVAEQSTPNLWHFPEASVLCAF